MTVAALVVALTVVTIPSGVELTLYWSMGLPPSTAGASQVTVAVSSPATALTLVGGPGTLSGTTLADVVDGGLAPRALRAVTVNVYGAPLVRPVTTPVRSVPLTAFDKPSGLETILYRRIALPPSDAGADQFTVASALPGTAEMFVGASGGPFGVVVADRADGALAPTALLAPTRKVYGVPLVSPVTMALRTAPPTEAVKSPGVEVTLYEVTGLPPSEAGAIQLTVA